MPQQVLKNIVAHWSKLFEGFRTSSQEFYTLVERALDRRTVPGLKVERIQWSEGGILSPNREYLRVTGDRHVVDICAAPFGAGFFFSSWTTRRQASKALLYLTGLTLLTVLIGRALSMLLSVVPTRLGSGIPGLIGFIMSAYALTYPVAFLIVLWLVAIAAAGGNVGAELAVLIVPGLGWLYERVFAQVTYYRVDTLNMFHSAVHAALMEAIDDQTKQKGLRALTDEERKPIFREMITGTGLAYSARVRVPIPATDGPESSAEEEPRDVAVAAT